MGTPQNLQGNNEADPVPATPCDKSKPSLHLHRADICFATNYLGHFLLSHLLLDTIAASAPSRIVNLASVMHWAGTAAFEPLLSGPCATGYSESKLAMVMHANELCVRVRQMYPDRDVRVFSVDPGFTASDIWRNFNRGPWALIDVVCSWPLRHEV